MLRFLCIVVEAWIVICLLANLGVEYLEATFAKAWHIARDLMLAWIRHFRRMRPSGDLLTNLTPTSLVGVVLLCDHLFLGSERPAATQRVVPEEANAHGQNLCHHFG